MKTTLQPGLARTEQIAIDRSRTIDFMGDDCRVYATPELVRDIETCSRRLLAGHLDPGEDSVGTRIAIDHLAATPLGMTADITVTITAVEGRKVTLLVEGRDAVDRIVAGEHQRFIVDTATTHRRLLAKLEKAR
jgi:fluoroacetyl-CoA thioesterase